MADSNTETFYFENPGPQNTDKTLKLALIRAKSLGIKDIVVASTKGETGIKAAEIFKDYNLVVVTHSTGFREPDFQEMPQKRKEEIESKGGKVLTCQHAFGGVNRAVRKKMGTYQLDEIIAYTFRTFCEGMKVAVEIILMAADAGLIRTDKEAITIAGTGQGADTALVVKPANAQNLFDLEIREILCKPRILK
ncbi:MAG: pyruvate kinase alpha/beta domain-containing protein [Candidatus Zixiibacteriota bacterium]